MAPGVPETQQRSLRAWGFSDGGDDFDKLDEKTYTLGKEMALKQEANCEAFFLLHFL